MMRLTAFAPAGRTRQLALKLFGSTVLAQLAALLATTIAAIYLDPVQFAHFGVVMAVSAITSSVNSLATQTRIPVVPEDEASALGRAGMTSAAGTGVLVILLGMSLMGSRPTLALLLMLSAVASCALALVALLTAFAIRAERQELLARNRVVQGFTNAALLTLLLFTSVPGYLALSLAWATSLLVGAFVMTFGLKGSLGWLRPTKAGDFTTAFRHVRSQPVNNLLASLFTSLPALLLPALGATTVAGAWALLSRILNAVVQTVFMTTSPLYVGGASKFVREMRHDQLRHHQNKWLLRLLGLTAPLALGIAVGILWLTPALGEEWEATQSLVWAALLYFPAAMVWLPVSQTLILMSRIDLETWWSFGAVTVSAASLALVPAFGGVGAMTVWAATQPLVMALHLWLQRRAIRPTTSH